MSFKLPIGAVYPSMDLYSAYVSPPTPSSTIRSSTVTNSSALPGPALAVCVDGVLLWLLLVWITAGTAALVTILVKSCRNR